jgi:hypothetical protein
MQDAAERRQAFVMKEKSELSESDFARRIRSSVQVLNFSFKSARYLLPRIRPFASIMANSVLPIIKFLSV